MESDYTYNNESLGKEKIQILAYIIVIDPADTNGMKLNVCHAPLLARFFFSVISTAT